MVSGAAYLFNAVRDADKDRHHETKRSRPGASGSLPPQIAMVAACARVTMDVVPFALTNLEGRVAGLNRIGMRRAGLPPEHVEEIRQAYRILFARGVPFRQAVGQLASEHLSAPGQRLVRFLERDTRRGVGGRSRTRAEYSDVAAESE